MRMGWMILSPRAFHSIHRSSAQSESPLSALLWLFKTFSSHLWKEAPSLPPSMFLMGPIFPCRTDKAIEWRVLIRIHFSSFTFSINLHSLLLFHYCNMLSVPLNQMDSIWENGQFKQGITPTTVLINFWWLVIWWCLIRCCQHPPKWRRFSVFLTDMEIQFIPVVNIQ